MNEPLIELKEVSWEEIEKHCNTLKEKILSSAIKFDTILCVGRGGMIPSRILSEKLNIPDIRFVSVKLYREIGTKGRIQYDGNNIGNIHNKNVLIVDDILDSGETIDHVINTEIGRKSVQDIPYSFKVATLYCKMDNIRKPSYYAEDVPRHIWLVFPWEKK